MITVFPPLIYIFFIFSGTIISISSSSMFGIWLGLEFNLIAFIPIIINLERNKKRSEAAIKYFLIQSVASLIVIFSIILFFIYSNYFSIIIPKFILTVSLRIKLGIAPFHIWFPEVIEGLRWANSLILLTWQKISPLVIISLFFNSTLLLLLAIFSALIGALSGLNQTSLRKILTYSSIAHTGWITRIIYFNRNIWINYFIIYRLTRIILCIIFLYININYFSQIVLTGIIRKKFIIFINLFSLGGLPPLLGFFPKWLAFSVLKQRAPVLRILIFSRLTTLYFYTRLCFRAFTLSFQRFTWNLKEYGKVNLFLLRILTLFTITRILPLRIIRI